MVFICVFSAANYLSDKELSAVSCARNSWLGSKRKGGGFLTGLSGVRYTGDAGKEEENCWILDNSQSVTGMSQMAPGKHQQSPGIVPKRSAMEMLWVLGYTRVHSPGFSW